MISGTFREELGLTDMNSFFDYLIQLEKDGMYAQLREMINRMDKKEFKEFEEYYEDLELEIDFNQYRGEIILKNRRKIEQDGEV